MSKILYHTLYLGIRRLLGMRQVSWVTENASTELCNNHLFKQGSKINFLMKT